MEQVASVQVNQLGDVTDFVGQDGVPRAVDPSTWGWLRPGGANDPEFRRSVTSLEDLPGFTVEPPEPLERSFIPGPKAGGSWMAWAGGHAPPAAVESEGGTRAYFNRLSEAASHVSVGAPRRVKAGTASTMFVYDFVMGKCHEVRYLAPASPRPGTGTVYVLDDGFALKFGYTSNAVAIRVSEMQTGNPRPLAVFAEVTDATPQTEVDLHATLERWALRGEWFDRAGVIGEMRAHGNAQDWLADQTSIDRGFIHVHPPYR